MSKAQGFRRRLACAAAGWRAAWRGEKSLRTQGLAAIIVVALLSLVRAPAAWWAAMALAIGLVLATELLNTALETLADHLHPALHEAVGRAKDIAAAAVLVASLAALVVGAAFVVDQLWPWFWLRAWPTWHGL